MTTEIICKNYNAFLCGLFASLVSFFGKLSSSSDNFNEQYRWVLMASGVVLMICSNVLVWIYFVKALQSTSSVKATVISSASNYFLSAFLGCIMFNERTSLYFWIGMTLVLGGLFLISKEDDKLIKTE